MMEATSFGEKHMTGRYRLNGLVALGTFTVAIVGASSRADDWSQWRGTNRDGVWRETGIIEAFDKPQLDIVWRAKIGGGYSSPSVAGGRVYVTDRLTKPTQVERVHCLDQKTGRSLWTHTYDCVYRGVGYETGPRAAVTVNDGRAFSLGSMGHLFALDAETGSVLWGHDLNKKYAIRMPVWGIAAAPLVEKNLVIVQIGGEERACLVAFDTMSGEEKWRALNDNASYSAPIIVEQAGERVLVVYTGENVVGLDPMSGKVHWTHPFPPERMVIGIASPVLYEDKLLVTNFFDGALLLKLGRERLDVSPLWKHVGPNEKESEAIQSIISTPYLSDGYAYGVDSYGELRCLDLATGERVWETLDVMPKARWATAHLIPNGDNVWIFNERGELIISKLSPKGYKEISRAQLIAPTKGQLNRRGGVCWTHPAFANKHVFVRNDEEIVCANLAAK